MFKFLFAFKNTNTENVLGITLKLLSESLTCIEDFSFTLRTHDTLNMPKWGVIHFNASLWVLSSFSFCNYSTFIIVVEQLNSLAVELVSR